MKDTETLSKLFLELAHVVPSGTKTFRELELEKEIERHEKTADQLADSLAKAVDEIDRLIVVIRELRAFVGEGTFSRQEVIDYVGRALEEQDRE